MKKNQSKIKKLLTISICLSMFVAIFCGLPAGASHTLNSNIAASNKENRGSTYWAILVCGSNHYWKGFETDIRDMWELLTNELQYDKDNIYYVAPYNWNSAIHYYDIKIGKQKIADAFFDVGLLSDSSDRVFFFYTAHGMPYYLDGNGDNYCDSSDMEADELSNIISWVEPNQQTVILLQGCKCGSFISNLSAPNRITMSATDSTHLSYEDMGGWFDPGDDDYPADWDPNGPDDDGAWNPGNRNWDGSIFSAGFRMAFRDFDGDDYREADDDTYINLPGYNPKYPPDFVGDKDGRVSVAEAFYFAKFEDCLSPHWDNHNIYPYYHEYPQINANNIDPFTTYIYSLKPDKPSINGPKKGNPGIIYDYTFKSIDPDGDKVYYYIDWGDGTNSGWIGPYPSGSDVTQKHTWSKSGSYTIEAKAKDIYDAESDLSYFQVTIPRNKVIYHLLFSKLFERFSNVFPTLQRFSQLLG